MSLKNRLKCKKDSRISIEKMEQLGNCWACEEQNKCRARLYYAESFGVIEMLLFRPEHIKPILDGTKTQTRRVWKRSRVKKGSIHKAKTKLFSKDYFALLKIKDVWREEFHCITEDDARKEGGYTREEYIRKFFEINPKIYKLTDKGRLPFNVWVVEFETVQRLPTFLG